MSRAAG